MGSDDLLPYPLAGADSRPTDGGVERGRGAGRGHVRAAAPLVAVPVAVLVLGLIAATAWLAYRWQAERALVADLTDELAEARTAAEQSQSAARDAVADPLTAQQAFSSEMVVASVRVQRFLDEVERSPEAADPQVFAAAFFGVQMRTTGWIGLRGRSGAQGVLARLDDPQRPAVVWVSRRSAETIDPSEPSRTNCLQLDVERLVQSAAAGRTWGQGADTAPLRWWSDVYRFVPPQECGA